MPRSLLAPAIVVLTVVASACGDTGTDAGAGATPASTTAAAESPLPAESDPPSGGGAVAPGTDLNACEIVAASDIASAVGADPAEVADGELTESPTVLSPGRSVCRYTGDWGGLVVELIPEDGVNLYDAARRAYEDASDLETGGADSAFWSASTKRGFFWKSTVTVMLQISHLTGGAEFAAATEALGQAAMDRVD